VTSSPLAEHQLRTGTQTRTGSSRSRLATSPATLPLSLGLLGFFAAFAGSWIPSFWGDEAASVMSAERSLPSLFKELGKVDAVHGTYYFFLHFWIQLFGASELSVRLPSAIAVGILVAGTFVLGRMLGGRNVGIVAALLIAASPRTSYIGADARSYAMSAALGVWLTILLVALIRRRVTGRIAWAGYAVLAALGMYLFLYLGLLLVVHGLYLFSSRRTEGTRRRWMTATAAALVLALPIIVFGYAQRSQVAFLAKRDYGTPYGILVTQWFANNLALAIVSWVLMLSAVGVAVIAWRRGRRQPSMANSRLANFELIKLGVIWTALPSLLLLAMNFVSPTYNLRYLTFCIPGIALLMAFGILALRRRWIIVGAVAVAVALTIPTDIAQRLPYAKDGGSDIAQTAALIGSEAHAGDGVVFDRTTKPSERPRLGKHLFPSDYAGLVDVALRTPYYKRAGIWDTTWPLSQVTDRLDGINTVWVVELEGSTDFTDDTDVSTLEGLGYYVANTQTVNRTVIYELTKGS
jgi:mannosyltransferase